MLKEGKIVTLFPQYIIYNKLKIFQISDRAISKILFLFGIYFVLMFALLVF